LKRREPFTSLVAGVLFFCGKKAITDVGKQPEIYLSGFIRDRTMRKRMSAPLRHYGLHKVFTLLNEQICTTLLTNNKQKGDKFHE